VVEGSEVFGNQSGGISVSNYMAGTIVVGASDVALGRGNRVHDHLTYGIYAEGGVLVSGNTVSGTAGSGVGIYLSGGRAASNVVHGHHDGIVSWDAAVEGTAATGTRTPASRPMCTRRRRCSSGPTRSTGTGTASGSRPCTRQGAGAEISHNVIYGNTESGLLLPEPRAVPRREQHRLPARRGRGVLQQRAMHTTLANNILWVGAGRAIVVSDDSQQGFASDSNLFYTQGTGVAGEWQGVSRTTLSAWRMAPTPMPRACSGIRSSWTPTAADNVLGYADPTHDGRDDDFHRRAGRAASTGDRCRR